MGLENQIEKGEVTIFNKTQNESIETSLSLSQREMDMLLAGGQLNYLKKQLADK